MEGINLKSQLESLVKLQALDSEIYSLNNEKESKPLEIQEIEARFEEKKKMLAELEKNSQDIQKQKKDVELELGTKEEGVKKLQSQLYALKTNKEYNTMLQQIADAKADVSVTEDKILQALEQIDKLKIEIDQEKARLKEEEIIFNQEKKKVEERIKIIDDRLAVLDGQRKQVIPEIDQKIFTQYERILANREGLGIVLVKNGSCQGCNMSMPPQVINLIKMYDNIITCEICNRILYIDE